MRTAQELGAQELADSPPRSASSTAAPSTCNVVVDPELLGGLRIEIGDDVIDGTVSSRLDDARRASPADAGAQATNRTPRRHKRVGKK